MAKTTFLTDEQVESEIARLTKTDAVKLARREQRVKYRRARCFIRCVCWKSAASS